jgi:hypothetical protein
VAKKGCQEKGPKRAKRQATKLGLRKVLAFLEISGGGREENILASWLFHFSRRDLRGEKEGLARIR